MISNGVKVKICGITNMEDAMDAIELGADALGFVFAESPRKITANTAKKIIDNLPPYITTVGVFVNEKPDKILEITKKCRLDRVQLHGEETPEYCKKLGLKIVKTIKSNIEIIPKYKVEGILLDISKGRGRLFDWDLAKQAARYGKPVILAGGLCADNVSEAIKKVKPYGVDVSSGVERTPGKKEYEKMKQFIMEAKGYAA